MYFDNYVHGNIRVEEGEVRTGKDPKTSLVCKNLRGASVKDDNDNRFALIFDKGQNLFIITRNGHVDRGVFKELDENGNIVLDKGYSFDPRDIVFMGEGRNC